MIKDRTRSFCRVMRFAAYGAAQWFAGSRANDSGHRNEWCPIVLRWRRRRRSANTITSRVNAQSSRVSYFPQFHFHHISHLHAGMSRRRTDRATSDASPRERRTILEKRWSMIGKNAVAASPESVWRDNRKAAPVYLPKTMRSSTPMTMRRLASRKRSTRDTNPTGLPIRQASLSTSERHFAKRGPSIPSVAGWPVAQTVKTSLEAEPELRRARQMELQTQLMRKHSHIWHHHHRVANFPSPESGVAGPRRSANASVFRFHHSCSEELVWRRGPATRFDPYHEADDDPLRGPLTQRRTQLSSQASDESPQVTMPVNVPATPQQITKLDPALLDRLTDNIISRVEKRISIERERRGL